MKTFEYFKPNTIEEVSLKLLEYGDSKILNGGTDLIVALNEGRSCPSIVVDIKGIEKLKEISYCEDNGLTVGACTTLNDMMNNRYVIGNYKILAEAAHTVGSCQVRNRATMVGNITNASPLADTATPLLILDAFVKIFGPGGEREISIHDFFISVRKTCLKAGEVVVGIRIPAYKEILGLYQKHARRDAVDLATVCASIAKIDGDIRIALGSVAPTPIRCRRTEEYLRDKDLTEIVIEEAANLALDEASPIDDVRASRVHRQDIIKVLVKRGLKELVI
ncbi:FAD binding domain-containing protein [Alkaliphilus peptidifermentans]|uniref:Carbon-monoxide dehydrogenase medium subunit n=1 Tax=Alkaliphilus peptidifermentans DSM 18978 TaxID=1120976 RepID=A0A1G5IDU6_9FIRM|nr:xanthine dehydrogenase family protein subunit M [Alkaliphilus peptidifermentans]SCY73558.1 carbon-monoxide dehydrogenase medium subunit [Alkaliphilus peptidifermentans DSM 18978]